MLKQSLSYRKIREICHTKFFKIDRHYKKSLNINGQERFKTEDYYTLISFPFNDMSIRIFTGLPKQKKKRILQPWIETVYKDITLEHTRTFLDTPDTLFKTIAYFFFCTRNIPEKFLKKEEL